MKYLQIRITPVKVSARATALFVCAFLGLMFTPAVRAQLTTAGTLNGTVIDSSGGVVPKAAISISNEETQVQTQTESNADGSFAVAGLPPGRYKVTVVKTGFQTFTETGIVLNAAQVVTVNASLIVGHVTTTVNIQASAAQVQTSTPEVSNVVNEQTVVTLPLNGRNYQSLSFLMPGVTNVSPDRAQGQGGFATFNSISVNGMGMAGTMYFVDGIWDENDGDLIQTTIIPNPDTIQEVRLLQNNFGSQYTLNGANVMLVETKSGTQTFHGSAFEYLRNNAFDARNFFSPTVSSLQQNIFGYTIGGPFFVPGHYNTKKDKTYFFWSEQWVSRHTGNVIRAADPTQDQRNGTFTTPIRDPLTGMPFPQTSPGAFQIPANRINSGALALLNAMAPLPNNPAGGFLNYLNSLPSITDQRDDEIKVDQIFGSKLRLMAEYLDERQTNNNPSQSFPFGASPYSTTQINITSPNQLAQVRLTQLLSPSMVNTTSVSMNNYIVNLGVSGLQFQSQVPGFQEVLPFPITPRGGAAADRLPYIVFAAGGYPNLGLFAALPIVHGSDLEDTLSDDWSWLHGNHYVQAGVQYVRGTKRQTDFGATAGVFILTGQFTGNVLADYLLGHAAAMEQQSTEYRPYVHYPIASPYVQDQWKATRRLTLTLGLRYAYEPNPHYEKSQSGLFTNFVPSLYNPAEAPIINLNGTITPTPNYNPLNGIVFLGKNAPLNYSNENKNYWDPTVGFAYDLFGDGKTAIRGGYGITHINDFFASCGTGCAANPPNVTTVTLVTPGFPNSTGGHPAPATAPTVGSEALNLRAPVVQTYSLSVQHQFGEWFASVAGAGNIARYLSLVANINQPVPEGGFNFNPIINTGSVSDYATSLAGHVPYQGYGALSTNLSIGDANWNALELNVKHAVGHNVFFSAAYTWQHGLSEVRGTGGLQMTSGLQDIYHPADDYGTANSNTTHVLAISGIWNIPLFRSSSGWKKSLLGGWSYSDITSLQSGFALDPGLSVGTAGLAPLPDRVPGTSIAGPKKVAEWFNTAAFTAPPAGFFGNATPGSIVGPGMIDFDMALYKDFKIKERHTFQFRAEFFNVFNHTNFSGVSTGFGAGNYGQVASALDPRIMEFALRYQF